MPPSEDPAPRIMEVLLQSHSCQIILLEEVKKKFMKKIMVRTVISWGPAKCICHINFCLFYLIFYVAFVAEIIRGLKDSLPLNIRDTNISYPLSTVKLTVWLQAFYQITNNLSVKDTNILHHYPRYILQLIKKVSKSIRIIRLLFIGGILMAYYACFGM